MARIVTACTRNTLLGWHTPNYSLHTPQILFRMPASSIMTALGFLQLQYLRLEILNSSL
jgi:hypothetical protein